MRKGDWRAWIVVAVLGGMLCVGMAKLARFSSSTAYPFYSSLGTGPLGTGVLFEALNRTGKIRATRNYLPLDQLRLRNADFLYLGVHPLTLATAGDRFFLELEDIARQGNRVIVGVTTGYIDIGNFTIGQGAVFGTESDHNPWGIQVRNTERDKKKSADYVIDPDKTWQALPDDVAWERNFGSGTVVLVANANRFLNRDLVSDPRKTAAASKNNDARRMIPWLIGGRRTVIFDESHLGVIETGSVASLARQYRLGGLASGLLAITALFFWKNAVRFPPALSDEVETETVVVARNTQPLLADLLQRHITRNRLIEVCIGEWNRVRPDKRIDPKTLRPQDPVAAYREISGQLGRRKSI